MKRLLPFLLIIFSCSNNSSTSSSSKSNQENKDSIVKVKPIEKPNVTYQVVNQSNNSSVLNYDIFIKDTTKISTLNEYLVNLYDQDKQVFLSINYFNNLKVAETYFKKQFSETVSEAEKDRLFKFYIAAYKLNPSTGFDKLSFLHQ
jgi:hypothetical protein